MEEIKPFDPVSFLEVVDHLVQQNNHEAYNRTAVGRSYYTVFLIAREKFSFGKKTSHWDVISAVKGKNRARGDQLDNLRRRRWGADYDLEVQVSVQDARDSVAIARILQNWLLKLRLATR